MTDYELAYEIASRAHANQVDKAGKPYLHHPLAVADGVESEEAKVVALLHDIAEDTPITLDSLRALFGDTIADALTCLTHREGERYDEYVRRAAANPLARKVKMADLTHNMDLSRLPVVTDWDRERVKKYQRAMAYLKSVDLE